MSRASADGAAADAFLGRSRFVETPDGRRLHVRVSSPAGASTGVAGESTVVWMAGMGMSGLMWSPLQHRAGRRVRSVIVDRAGLGRSTEDPAPRTLQRMAGDLIVVLDALGGAPAVLVGHSWGGPIVRTAAVLRPDLVRALVLVDPSDEGILGMLPQPGRRAAPGLRRAARILSLLAIARTPGWRRAEIPPAVRRGLRRAELSRVASRTAESEQSRFFSELAALAAAPPLPETLPVTIISGALVPRGGRTRRIRLAMTAAHARSAAGRSASVLVSAERSGHLVPLTEPELVLDAVWAALPGGAST